MAIQYELFTAPVSETELVKYGSAIRNMVNEAFATQDRSFYGSQEMFPNAGNMLPLADSLTGNLGEVGFAAVAFDSVSDRRTPVAIACIKPWSGRALVKWEAIMRAKEIGLELKDKSLSCNNSDQEVTDVTEWELVCVASKNDPKYRHQGLTKRCIAMVEQQLIAQSAAWDSKIVEIRQRNLWVTALEGVGNAEYYERRGFIRDGESDSAHEGVWGAKGPFKIAHLKKVLKSPE